MGVAGQALVPQMDVAGQAFVPQVEVASQAFVPQMEAAGIDLCVQILSRAKAMNDER